MSGVVLLTSRPREPRVIVEPVANERAVSAAAAFFARSREPASPPVAFTPLNYGFTF